MNRVVLAGMVGIVSGVAISACVVNREGAPCDRDDNCPRSQFCDLDNHCKELTRNLELDDACQLVLISLSQRFSECAGGRPQDWLDFFLPDQVCATYADSVDARRLSYQPMLLKECRAALFANTCDQLSSRATAAGRMLENCRMLGGVVESGGACATTKDCDAGHCDTSAGCLGTCKTYISVGNPCSATDLCEAGATCADGVCKAYVATGGSCAADAGPCQPFTALCDGTQTCVPRRPAGTAGCDYAGAGYFCQQNLNCVGPLAFATRICQQGIALDQPCSPNTNSCDRFTYCATRDGGTNLCSPIPGPGGGCGLSPPAGAQDLVLLCRESYCNGFTCVGYKPIGQGCGNDGECGPLARCQGGACRSQFCP